MSREIRALLVGIETWKSEQLAAYPLEGCLNDVALVERTLTERFCARPEHIRVLRDAEATRDAILTGLREWLLEPARGWSESGRAAPAPALVFHFSGHGSESLDPTGTQPNGRDQTIVPHDSRTPGVFDIKDWELGEVLAEIARYNDNLTVILDCCHSGSGTRSIERRPRACPADLRVPPRGRPQAATRGIAPPALGHVLLAACAAHQAAFPYDDDSSGRRSTYGMFSYALAQTLAAPDATTLSYRALHARVARLLQGWGASQTPQCEGDRDRRLFSTQHTAPAAPWRLVERSEGGGMIDAGAMHGLAVGDLLDVYPAPAQSLAEDSDVEPDDHSDVEPRWQVLVTRVAAACSEVQFRPRDAARGILVAPPQDSIPLDAAVGPARERPAIGAGVERRACLSLTRLSREQKEEVERWLAADSLYSRLVAVDAPDAPLHLDRLADQWRLFDRDRRLLAAWPSDAVRSGVETLARHAWSQFVLSIHNSRRSPLADRLGCAVRKVVLGGPRKPRPGELPTEAFPPPEAGRELCLAEGTPICFEFRNDSDRPLYLQAFFVGYDGSIARVYPKSAGDQSAVAPGRTATSSGFRLHFAPGESDEVCEVREWVKLFASASPCDLESLCDASACRALHLDRPDDWTTIETSFLMKRRPNPVE